MRYRRADIKRLYFKKKYSISKESNKLNQVDLKQKEIGIKDKPIKAAIKKETKTQGLNQLKILPNKNLYLTIRTKN